MPEAPFGKRPFGHAPFGASWPAAAGGGTNCKLLLNDGSSRILLNDGTSVILLNDDSCTGGVTAPPGHPIGAGITRLTSGSESSSLHPIFDSQITG